MTSELPNINSSNEIYTLIKEELANLEDYNDKLHHGVSTSDEKLMDSQSSTVDTWQRNVNDCFNVSDDDSDSTIDYEDAKEHVERFHCKCSHISMSWKGLKRHILLEHGDERLINYEKGRSSSFNSCDKTRTEELTKATPIRNETRKSQSLKSSPDNQTVNSQLTEEKQSHTKNKVRESGGLKLRTRGNERSQLIKEEGICNIDIKESRIPTTHNNEQTVKGSLTKKSRIKSKRKVRSPTSREDKQPKNHPSSKKSQILIIKRNFRSLKSCDNESTVNVQLTDGKEAPIQTVTPDSLTLEASNSKQNEPDNSDIKGDIQNNCEILSVKSCDDEDNQDNEEDMWTPVHERPFKCEEQQCGRTYRSSTHLRSHMQQKHTPVAVTKCTECNYTTTNAKYLPKHMKTRHSDPPYKCTLCDFRCALLKYLTVHEHSEHRNEIPPKHICPYCGYISYRRSGLTNHLFVHQEERPFLCTECGRSFRRKVHLTRHITSIHSTDTPFACEVEKCEYVTKTMAQLKRHVSIKHATHNYKTCEYCPFKTKTATVIRKHVMSKHVINHPHKCPRCHYTCVDKRSLATHIMSVHTKERPFQCSQCEFQTTVKLQLKRHFLCRHTTERNFKCTQCDFKTYALGILNKHIKSKHIIGHWTTKYNFICSQCDYKTYSTGILKKHIEKKHGS